MTDFGKTKNFFSTKLSISGPLSDSLLVILNLITMFVLFVSFVKYSILVQPIKTVFSKRDKEQDVMGMPKFKLVENIS